MEMHGSASCERQNSHCAAANMHAMLAGFYKMSSAIEWIHAENCSCKVFKGVSVRWLPAVVSGDICFVGDKDLVLSKGDAEADQNVH